MPRDTEDSPGTAALARWEDAVGRIEAALIAAKAAAEGEEP